MISYDITSEGTSHIAELTIIDRREKARPRGIISRGGIVSVMMVSSSRQHCIPLQFGVHPARFLAVDLRGIDVVFHVENRGQ